MVRSAWVLSCLLTGCFSSDNFDLAVPDDPNAPRPCDSRGHCKPANYAVRACVQGVCIEPPIPEATLAPLPQLIEATRDFRGQGTVIIPGATLATMMENTNILQIRADNIIIDGIINADPSLNDVVHIWAEQNIWIRGESRLQSQGGQSAPVYFTIQAGNNLYVDQSVLLHNQGACTCLFGETLGHSDHLRKDHDCDPNRLCERLF